MSDLPWIFDRFVQNDAGQPITDASTTAAGLARSATSRLFFDGPATRAHAGGDRAVLETPKVWVAGSSGDHLAEDVYPLGRDGSLMTPILNGREIIRASLAAS